MVDMGGKSSVIDDHDDTYISFKDPMRVAIYIRIRRMMLFDYFIFTLSTLIYSLIERVW